MADVTPDQLAKAMGLLGPVRSRAEYLASALSGPEHAQAARDAAAARTRRAVLPPPEGRPDFPSEQLQAGANAALQMFPGVNAVQHAAAGEYGEAAGSAALDALPFGARYFGPAAMKAGLAAYGAGSVMSPQATGGGLIDSLPENERSMYQDMLKQAGRNKDRDARAAAIADINRRIAERATALRDEERRLATEGAAVQKWMTDNAGSINSLPELQQGQIRGASPADRPALLQKLLHDKEEANKTFAERHVPELETARAASAIAGVAFPAWQRYRQVGSLERATERTDAALAAASRAVKKGRLPAAADTELSTATKRLGENVNLPSGAHEFGKELAYGSLLPYGVATFAPNALEAMGRFNNGTPEDREVGMRAVKQMFDPWGAGVSLAEGGIATLLGQYLGRGLKNANVAAANARGTLTSATSQADKWAAEAQKEAEKKANAAAKAAATRARNRGSQGTP